MKNRKLHHRKRTNLRHNLCADARTMPSDNRINTIFIPYPVPIFLKGNDYKRFQNDYMELLKKHKMSHKKYGFVLNKNASDGFEVYIAKNDQVYLCGRQVWLKKESDKKQNILKCWPKKYVRFLSYLLRHRMKEVDSSLLIQYALLFTPQKACKYAFQTEPKQHRALERIARDIAAAFSDTLEIERIGYEIMRWCASENWYKMCAIKAKSILS